MAQNTNTTHTYFWYDINKRNLTGGTYSIFNSKRHLPLYSRITVSTADLADCLFMQI